MAVKNVAVSVLTRLDNGYIIKVSIDTAEEAN